MRKAKSLKRVILLFIYLLLVWSLSEVALDLINDGVLNQDLTYIAYASSETTNNPSAYEVPAGNWGFPTDGYTSDDQDAMMARIDGGFYEIRYYNYNFDLGSADIEEVYLIVEHLSGHPEDVCEVRVSRSGGTSWSSYVNVPVSTKETTHEIDVTAAYPWVASDFSNANFKTSLHADINGTGCYHPDSEVGLWENKSINFKMNVKNIADVKKGDILLGYNKTTGEYIPNLMLSDAIIMKGNFTFYRFLTEYPMGLWDKEIYDWTNPKEKGYKDTAVTAEQRMFTVENGLVNASEVEVGMHLHGLFRQEGRLVTIPVLVTEITTFKGNKAVALDGTTEFFFSHYTLERIVKTYHLDWLGVKVVYTSFHNTTFYFHNCGTILVNGSVTANGTTTVYNSSETFNLTALPIESMSFLKHEYDGIERYENPLLFSPDGNYSFHTWFSRNASFNPNSETLVNGTTQTSGSFPADIEENDGSYKIFQSVIISQPYGAQDFVDDNTTDVDSSPSIGSHSNFTAMKYSNSIYDRITDEDGETPQVENLYVNQWVNVIDEWTRVGADPYLNAQDQPTNYVHVSAKTMAEGDWNFTDVSADGSSYTLHSVQLVMYYDAGSEKVAATLYDGSGWSGDYIFTGSPYSWGWADVSAFLNTKTKIDDALLHLESQAAGGWSGTVGVDAAYILVNLTAHKSTADLELQFTDVPYDKENEELCIKTGDVEMAQDLGVRGWNGSAWTMINTTLSWNTWNNYSVSSLLTSNTFTINLFNSASASHWWDIDAVLLHLWTDGEYNATIEFEGSSNAEIWQKLNFTVDAAVTNASVSVTYQLYNYTAGAYASSGLGYISYTSSATPNTDELKWQQINSSDCTDFRDGSNNWKLKVEAYSNPSGMGNTTLQHEIKLDWIQFTPFWLCTGIEAVVVREIIFLFVTAIFFSAYYEFDREKVWSAIFGAGLWIVISILWIVRSVDLWILCLFFSGIGIFYILRVVLSLLEMRRIRQRGLSNGNVSV